MLEKMETHGRRIRIFRNGDLYYPGKKMLISPTYHRNFEQEVQNPNGVRKLFGMDGKRIRALEDLQDGVSYVGTNGESFKNVSYSVEETGPSFKAYSKPFLHIPVINDNPILERKQVNRSAGGLLSEDVVLRGSEESLFLPTTKAFKIAVFENGEANQEGMKLILNHRNCKTFDQAFALMKYLSSLKIIKCGQVRKMYDIATGKRVRHISDLEYGMNLSLSAFDPYKKTTYKTFDLMHSLPAIKKEIDIPRVVKCFPNGDAYHSGVTITVTKKRHPSLGRFLEHLNTQITLVTGKIHKIYHMDGVKCFSIDELKSGGNYVLVANDDPFIKSQYNKMALKPTTSQRGLNGHTLHNDFVKLIRPVTTKRSRRDETSASSSRLKTAGKVKKSTSRRQFQQDGMETEEEHVPKKEKGICGINVEIRSKTPATEHVLVAYKPKTPQALAEQASRQKTPASAKPKTPAHNRAVAEDIHVESKSHKAAIESARPPIARQKTPVQNVSITKEKPKDGHHSKVTNSRIASPDGVPEDEHIKKHTGREEEELFQSERQSVKVLQSNKSKQRVQTAPSAISSLTSSMAELRHSAVVSQSSLIKQAMQNNSQSKIPRSQRTSQYSAIEDPDLQVDDGLDAEVY